MKNRRRLIDQTGRDMERLGKRERSPARFVLGIAVYGGTLGLLFVVPPVAGAYLGRYLDTLASGYSARWTISLILLGLGLGAYNVLHFLRGKL